MNNMKKQKPSERIEEIAKKMSDGNNKYGGDTRATHFYPEATIKYLDEQNETRNNTKKSNRESC